VICTACTAFLGCPIPKILHYRALHYAAAACWNSLFESIPEPAANKVARSITQGSDVTGLTRSTHHPTPHPLPTVKLAHPTPHDYLLHIAPYIERVNSLLTPYIDRIGPRLDPYISHLDSLLAALQLYFAPDSSPKPLIDLLPQLALSIGFITTTAIVMRRFLGLGGGRSPPARTGPISGDNSVDPYRPEDVLTVKHGANEYLFKYPTNTIATHALNIGHLRDKVAEITGVDVKRLSLICAGRQLKDDNITLQMLGIEHGAKVLAVGTNSAPPSRPVPQAAATPPPPKAPVGPAEKIEAVRDHVVTTLFPLVDNFIGGDGAESPEKRADMHRRLGETIMGELLKLDGVETEDPNIRARRKEVVREIQGALDALDKALKESP